MGKIKFSRLISDGAILQRDKKIHIWGYAPEGEEVCVSIIPSEASLKVTSDARGRFDAYFDKMDAGGPYTIRAELASGSSGNNDNEDICCVAKDVYIGDVFVISGQSNMEFPMARVKDTYPEEWRKPGDRYIRTFKIIERGEFAGPLEDVETGEWVMLDADSIDDYSAVGYFLAVTLRNQNSKNETVPVGLINVSLGGAPIEAFMSSEMLEGFDEALIEADKFANDDFRNEVLRQNEINAESWHGALDESDIGLAEGWMDGKRIIREGTDYYVPEYFSDTELKGFIGSVWFAKEFDVPARYANQDAVLWFGTITDYDFCYINGEFIGTTPYCYPPRRYPIPAGLLKPGRNTVVFRICVEGGFGRITPGKLLGVIFGDGKRITDGFTEQLEGAEYIIGLSGVWKYLKGCGDGVTESINPPEPAVFVNWKPTALFNGMLAPVTNYPVKAFCFYQGETNCPRAFEYAALTRRQIEGYRKLWKDEKLPYLCVQLPNFNARVEESSYDSGTAWRNLQKAQEEVENIENAYLIKSFGYGENNDLHPQRKEPIGRALAQTILNEQTSWK